MNRERGTRNSERGTAVNGIVVSAPRSALRVPRSFLLLPLVAIASASCTDLALRPYRNDRLLEEYRYTLGEKYADVGGLRFCYQEMGEGETVLILPGLGTSIDYWQFTIPALAAQYHVVAIDLPGLGKSDKPDADYQLSWIVEQIVAFMDARGIRQADVVGGSLGGHLALLLALNHPDRVSKLVLMGSVGDWPPPGVLLDAAIKLLWTDAMAIDYMRAHWPEIYARMFKRPTPFTQAVLRYDMALRANAARYYPQGRAASRILRSIFYSSCRDRLGEVAKPVLLVWGEGDEIHSAADTGLYFREHLPDSRLVVVPDAAHEVMVDQPQVFNRLVLTFLKSGTGAIADRYSSPIARK